MGGLECWPPSALEDENTRLKSAGRRDARQQHAQERLSKNSEAGRENSLRIGRDSKVTRSSFEAACRAEAAGMPKAISLEST